MTRTDGPAFKMAPGGDDNPSMNSHPRILVIEDDPLFRSILIAALRGDHLVSVASEGAEGYAKAQSFPPELVLLDMNMPGWSGLKTLQVFHSDETLCRVPVVMLTADASRATVTACITAGAANYLLKNCFSKQSLLNCVRATLKGVRNSGGPANSVGSPRHRTVHGAYTARG